MGCLTAKASGSIASFISPTVTPIESARVYFSPTQLGEGTPSPENVREIVGRTSVELKQCGKNLFDGEVLNARFKDVTIGEPIQIESTGTWRIPKNRIEVKGGSKLYCYTKYGELVNSTNRPYIVQTDENDNCISFTASFTPPLTLDTNTKYIRFQFLSTAWNQYSPYFFTTTPPKTIPFSWKRLPDEYQEVEYIENSGTQYLITDYVPTESSRYELQYEQIAEPTGDNMFFGYTNASTANYFELYNVIGRFYGASGLSRYQAIQIGSNKLPNIVSVSMSPNKLEIHDITNSPTAYYSQLSPISIGVFCWHRSTGAEYINKGARIYYLKAYNGDNLALNLIPCYRKSDNEIGMYDTVSQTFYTNQGIGTFTKGDDVFSDEVYGGYVDLVKGEIVETYYGYTVDGVNIKANSAYKNESRDIFGAGIVYNTPIGKNANNQYPTNIICNKIPVSASNSIYDIPFIYAPTAGSLYTVFYVGKISEHSEITTNADRIDFTNVWLQENPVQLIYELKTPITHPLPDYLKTQLQTLKNENTFWSDADSVEIEYGLAETFDIQKAKRKIIMNQPHVETLTGDVVSFTTDMKAPLKECKVSFMPVQEGSGDPSPDNVRNISGWASVEVLQSCRNLYGNTKGVIVPIHIPANTKWTASSSGSATVVVYDNNKNQIDNWALTNTDELTGRRYKTLSRSYDIYYVNITGSNASNTQFEVGDLTDYEAVTTTPISWQSDYGTIYGGYVDLVSGELVATHLAFVMDGTNYTVSTAGAVNSNNMAMAYSRMGYSDGLSTLPLGKNNTFLYACNKYLTPHDGGQTTDTEGIYCGTGRPYVRVVVNSDNLSDVSSASAIVNSINEWLQTNPIQICYELETPITYQLTPQQLITLKGQNNLWADTNGTTEIKFWKH